MLGVAGTVWSGMAAVERGLKRRRGEPELRGWKNFLVVQHGAALGTVVHSTPLIPALREAVPDCRIVVVASGMSRELYRGNPDVEALLETPDPTKDLRGAIKAMRGLKPFGEESFCTLAPVGNERTTVTMQSVVGSAGWLRVGFTVVPQLYAVPIEYDQARSQIENNLRIVEALGHPAARHHEPQIFFSEADIAFARGLLREAGALEEQPVAIFVTQTSVTQKKSWRAERFRAAAAFVQERYGAFVVFVGTGGESARIDTLRAGLGFATANVAGKTNLLQLAALLSLGDIGLTLDTGTMHIGRAVGLPMVIVAPAWSPPLEWLPLGDIRFRILKNLDMASAPEDYIIDEVSVEEVTAELAGLIERYPPGSYSGQRVLR